MRDTFKNEVVVSGDSCDALSLEGHLIENNRAFLRLPAWQTLV